MRQESKPDNSRRFTQIALALFAAHALLCGAFAAFRFVDWDEGFYLTAGQTIANGLRLYFDFFHPQAPVYPHLLSGLADGGWSMLFEARALNTALSLATMALVALCATRITRLNNRDAEPGQTRQVLLTALLLYAFNGLFISWNSVAKPLALAQFFVVLAIYLRLRAADRSAIATVVWIALSGAAITLAAQTRLPLLVVWPLLFIHTLLASDIRHKGLAALGFLTGAHLAAAPTIAMIAHDWRTVLYNNIGFHLTRDLPPTLSATLYDKLRTIGKLLIDPQVVVILALIVAAVWLGRHRRRRTDWLRRPDLLCLLAGAALFGAYLRAYPSLRQYLVQSLPLLIIFAAVGAPRVMEALKNKLQLRARRTLALALAVYVLGIIPYIAIYFVFVRGYDQKSVQSRVDTVVQVITDNSAPSDTVLAESPIYPLLAQRQPLPLTEFVGFQYYSLKLDDSYRRFNLPDTVYLQRAVRYSRPQLVITDFEPDPGLAARLAGNYELIFSDDYANIYRRLHQAVAPVDDQ